MFVCFFVFFFVFFFNDTATTEIYTLSLHDALPIWKNSKEYASRPSAGHGRGVLPYIQRQVRAVRVIGKTRKRNSTFILTCLINISIDIFYTYEICREMYAPQGSQPVNPKNPNTFAPRRSKVRRKEGALNGTARASVGLC